MVKLGRWLRIVSFGIAAAVLSAAAPPGVDAAVGAATLKVTRLSGSNVQVKAPAGSGQVVLEQRQGRGWQPIAVRHLPAGATSQTLSFPLPKGVSTADVRVLAYRGNRFPARTASAARRFQRTEVESPVALPVLTALNGDPARMGATGEAEPAVTESDIWQIAGHRLFFFNQYRGLQVLDLTDPSAPVRTGTLRLAASGEQFYVLDTAGSRLALLGQSRAADWTQSAALFLLAVTDGVPTLVAEIPLTGVVRDSRLIGDRLYVLSTVWSDPGQSRLQAIDLSDPQTPVVGPTLTLSGYADALQAAGGRLLVGTRDGWQPGIGQLSHLNLIDLGAADGAPALHKRFALAGPVTDKFKMGITAGAAIAVTQTWTDGHQQTWVETFPIDGTDTTPLARMELGAARDEQLHATRFDGDRLYVVTFRQTDPLFVIDLSDPAVPRESGVLEVPGWSTYIEPLGDRLLAVGVESGRVTVSLFDVSDAAAPALLARLPLGADGTRSWSEANYDEKAVGYYPEAGLVMVPFQSDGPNGPVAAVAAIGVSNDALTSEAVIPHAFSPRRGAVLGDFFVSISGRELLVVDRTADTDGQPAVEVSLAWATNRVLSWGDYLVQVEDGTLGHGFWPWQPDVTAGGHAWLRVSDAADPDDLLAEWDLGAGPIVGLTDRGGRLYVAQWVPPAGEAGARLRTWVFDLSGAPVLPDGPLTVVTHDLGGSTAANTRLEAGQLLWSGADTLVWYGPARANRYSGWWPMPVLYATTAKLVDTASAAVGAAPGWAAILCPITAATATPTAGPVRWAETGAADGFRGASRAFADGGFLFFSYDTATPRTVQTALPATQYGLAALVARPRVPERLNSWLRVIDLRDGGSEPILRSPVSIPGQLLGVVQADDQGAAVITSTERLGDRRSAVYRTLQASAYDGVDAHLLHSLATVSPVGAAAEAAGTAVYLATESAQPGVIGIGYTASSGQLAETARWNTASPQALALHQGHLLALGNGTLGLAATGAAGSLTPIASFKVQVDLPLSIDGADLAVGRGVWVPAGDYGVEYRTWPTLKTRSTARAP